jgi:hypothetical protein
MNGRVRAYKGRGKGIAKEFPEESGRWDLNPRPLGPEPSALARLRHAPCYTERTEYSHEFTEKQLLSDLGSQGVTDSRYNEKIASLVSRSSASSDISIQRIRLSALNHVVCRFANRLVLRLINSTIVL